MNFALNLVFGMFMAIVLGALVVAGLTDAFKHYGPSAAVANIDLESKFSYRVTWTSDVGTVRVFEHATNPFKYSDKSFTASTGEEVVVFSGILEAQKNTTAEKAP